MKILLDTNLILDFALERSPYDIHASLIFKLIENHRANAFVTATTVTDIFFISSKKVGKLRTKEFLIGLFDFVEIIDVGKQIVYNALNSDFVDFEDAVQNFSAKENDIDIIVTRNTKDFSLSTLSVMTPEEFLSKFN